MILVLADGSANTFIEDGSCVLENMMLAAHALGLGTVWVHREREIFDSESGKALLREWKLPETLCGVGAIALGYSSPGSRSARSTQTKLYCSDLMSCCPAQCFCAGHFVERRESMQTSN